MTHMIELGKENLYAEMLLGLLEERGISTLLLSGDLGAGKTTLTTAIARVLGITDSIISPTFIIERRYVIPNSSTYKDTWDNLIHIDAYRFESYEEASILKWSELVQNPRTLIVVEWPEKLFETLPSGALHVTLTHNSPTTRTASFSEV